MVGNASFSLYCLLSEVSMSTNPTSDVTLSFLEKLVESASDSRQKQLALHQLACTRFLRKDYAEAEPLFSAAFSAGHLYSVVGLARLTSLRGNKHFALKLLDSVACDEGQGYYLSRPLEGASFDALLLSISLPTG